MAVVNPTIARPLSCGGWVNETACQCGALYVDFRAYPSFADAADRLRKAAQAAGDDGGGYRSRRPVLWVMRCIKLDAWFQEHYACGGHYPVEVEKPYEVTAADELSPLWRG